MCIPCKNTVSGISPLPGSAAGVAVRAWVLAVPVYKDDLPADACLLPPHPDALNP